MIVTAATISDCNRPALLPVRESAMTDAPLQRRDTSLQHRDDFLQC
jgi:hypothetical protein